MVDTLAELLELGLKLQPFRLYSSELFAKFQTSFYAEPRDADFNTLGVQ